MSTPPANVAVFDSSNKQVFSFWQNGSITNSNFYDMLDIPYAIHGRFQVVRRSDASREIIPRDNQPLGLGEYVIENHGIQLDLPLSAESEAMRIYTPSRAVSTRSLLFRERVLRRDRLCVVSGLPLINNAEGAHHAAHIFPRNLEREWQRYGYARWIGGGTEPVQGSGIDSVRNGILLQATVHALLDKFMFGINPNDGYKIIYFAPDDLRIDGRTLDPCCRDPENRDRVSDELLLWHFRQAVLRNFRAAAEPRPWDYYYDPDGDILNSIQSGPHAALRMELELAARLGPVED